MLLSKSEGSVVYALKAYWRHVASFDSQGCKVSKMIEEEFIESSHKINPRLAGVGPPARPIIPCPDRDTEVLQRTQKPVESWIRERGGFFVVESIDSLELTLSACPAACDKIPRM